MLKGKGHHDLSVLPIAPCMPTWSAAGCDTGVSLSALKFSLQQATWGNSKQSFLHRECYADLGFWFFVVVLFFSPFYKCPTRFHNA